MSEDTLQLVDNDALLKLKDQVNKLQRARDEMIGKLFAPDFISTHRLGSARNLRTCTNEPVPNVLLAILAKQKERSLPLYLDCIERLDYPKSAISLYVRTNNNTDKTRELLEDWVARVGNMYRGVEMDTTDVTDCVQDFKVHEWNTTRFRVLSKIRNISLHKTLEHRCDYYFVCDVDNFIAPWTLAELTSLGLPVVAPLLRNFAEGSFNSNFFQDVDDNGYYKENNTLYLPLLTRVIRGIIETKLVHHTYLVRQDVIGQLTYDDGSGRYEFVVFADSARRANIPQYIDNRQIYGYITSGDEYGYFPGDEEEATKAGVTKPSQVAVTREIFEQLWSNTTSNK